MSFDVEQAMLLGTLQARQDATDHRCDERLSMIIDIKDAVAKISLAVEHIPLLRKEISSLDKRMAGVETKVTVMNNTLQDQTPIINDVKAIKSRGLKITSYLGAMLIVLGLVSTDVQELISTIFEKSKTYFSMH